MTSAYWSVKPVSFSSRALTNASIVTEAVKPVKPAQLIVQHAKTTQELFTTSTAPTIKISAFSLVQTHTTETKPLTYAKPVMLDVLNALDQVMALVQSVKITLGSTISWFLAPPFVPMFVLLEITLILRL